MAQTFRILLVEDDDSLRVCLSEFLASEGWAVAATSAADEAMNLVYRQRFDFSILDFHLPGATGLELFHQFASVRPLPAILMSGLASSEEAMAARSAGFFAFLRKPLELGQLRRTVEQLIRTHFGGPLTMLPPQLPGGQLPGSQLPGSQLGRPNFPSSPQQPPRGP